LSEYAQFAAIIKKLLVYRHQKHVQLEMTQDSLEAKREQLEDLEKHEREAARLEEALGRGRRPPPDAEPGLGGSEGAERGKAPANDADPQSKSMPALPPHPGPNPVRRRTPGMGLINALSYTLHGMIDADPEAARRSGISKNRETISQVWPVLFYFV
jgi:sorting nexin-41/42